MEEKEIEKNEEIVVENKSNTGLKVIIVITGLVEVLIKMSVFVNLPSKILGALVGFLEAWIITFGILVIVMVPFQREDEFKESTFANHILYKTPVMSDATSSFIKSVEEVYNLSSKISMEELEINDANVQSIDIMLKYDIIDKDTIKKLIKLNKLENIKGVDKVLDKH